MLCIFISLFKFIVPEKSHWGGSIKYVCTYKKALSYKIMKCFLPGIALLQKQKQSADDEFTTLGNFFDRRYIA